MFRLNNKGFSQVTLLIGVFFLAVVVAIVMRTVQKQTDNLNNIIAESEIVNFSNIVKRYLSSPTNCTATFQGIKINEGTVESLKVIKDGLESKRFEIFSKSQKTVGTRKLRIVEYKLNDYSVENDEEIGELGLVNLEIKISKNINNLKKLSSYSIRLYIKSKDKILDSCAFGGLPTSATIIQDKGSYAFINTESLSVNTQNTNAQLNIEGMVNLSSNDKECTDFLKGSIRYNSSLESFETCLNPPLWKKAHK